MTQPPPNTTKKTTVEDDGSGPNVFHNGIILIEVRKIEEMITFSGPMIFPPKFDLRLISSRLSRIKAKLFSAFAAPKFGSFVNYIYLCTQNQKNEVMTTLQLNAELFHELSIISEDEGMMKKAIKALKRITAQKQTMDETEYIMSSPEMVDVLRQGDEDIKNGRGRVVTLDEIWK